MNAVSVNVSAYCDLEKFSSDKFDPLIMNRIRVKSWELVTILPSPSSLVRYRSQIFIDHSGTNHQYFISSYCTAQYTPYCRHNAGRRGKLLLFMFSIRSHNMLCCVTLSRVITLYKQYHTHPALTNKDSSPGWREADESHQNMLHHECALWKLDKDFCVTWGFNNMTCVSWIKFYREIW